MKIIQGYFLIFITIMILVPQLLSADTTGNPRKGKYLYRKHCLKCHQYGTENQLGPDSKTMKEWQETFSKDNRSKIQCLKEWKTLSDKDIIDIYTHMHSHASDSPTPAACR